MPGFIGCDSPACFSQSILSSNPFLRIGDMLISQHGSAAGNFSFRGQWGQHRLLCVRGHSAEPPSNRCRVFQGESRKAKREERRRSRAGATFGSASNGTRASTCQVVSCWEGLPVLKKKGARFEAERR